MSDDTYDKEWMEEVSRMIDNMQTVIYNTDGQACQITTNAHGELILEPIQASINEKFEENQENDLTDKQRLCYHDWELVGKSPVLDEEWWNCSKCGIAKEKYYKIRQREMKKKQEWRKNLPTGEIYM